MLSRAEEGALPLKLGRHDVAELAAAVAGRLAPQFADKEVSLVVGPSGAAGAATPAVALVDPDRVTQLLTNVVGNALAYTEPGGRVAVAARRDDGDVVVEVTDSGRGIAPDELGRVFDRFHRVDRAGAGSGTGIGLTIARSIARAHGGEATAHSAGVGHGSTFVVRLPVDGPGATDTTDATEGP